MKVIQIQICDECYRGNLSYCRTRGCIFYDLNSLSADDKLEKIRKYGEVIREKKEIKRQIYMAGDLNFQMFAGPIKSLNEIMDEIPPKPFEYSAYIFKNYGGENIKIRKWNVESQSWEKI